MDLFEHIENFFKRLGVYNQISLTTEMAEVLVNIVIELLFILSIATKEVRRRRASNRASRFPHRAWPRKKVISSKASRNGPDRNLVREPSFLPWLKARDRRPERR